MNQLKNIPTPHIEAKSTSDIAEVVLMPGDPLRAKYIADTFLENVVQFNGVRGMLGYTGTYKNKRISVMGSGMGMPSMGIYSYELYNYYGVETILRVGSCGAMTTELNLMDIIIVNNSYSKSTFAKEAFDFEDGYMSGTESLNEILLETANKLGKKVIFGNIESGDAFYQSKQNTCEQNRLDEGILAGEMESFALFTNAKYLKKKAGCLLTVSDSIVNGTGISSDQRQNAFFDMMEIALESILKFSK